MLLCWIFLVALGGSLTVAKECLDSDNNIEPDTGKTCKELFSGKFSTQSKLCNYASVKRACCKNCPDITYDKSQDNVIEFAAYVDESAVKRYKGFGYADDKVETVMTDDIRYYIQQLNKMFASLAKYGLKITLSLTGVTFLDEAESQLVNKPTNPSAMLATLSKWLLTKPHAYDAGVLFTGHNLRLSRADIITHTRFASACLTSTVPSAIVEMSGSYRDVTATANSLGRLLGSLSDGKLSCRHGNIMSNRFNAKSKGRWSFSECTANEIMHHLGQYVRGNCLVKKQFNGSYVPELESNSTLDIENGSSVCERRYGKDYIIIPDKIALNNNLYQTMCLSTFCGKEGGSSFKSIMPSDGMECLKDVTSRGVCDKGTCI